MGKIILSVIDFNDTAVRVFPDYAIAGKGHSFNNSSSAKYDQKFIDGKWYYEGYPVF